MSLSLLDREKLIISLSYRFFFPFDIVTNSFVMILKFSENSLLKWWLNFMWGLFSNMELPMKVILYSDLLYPMHFQLLYSSKKYLVYWVDDSWKSTWFTSHLKGDFKRSISFIPVLTMLLPKTLFIDIPD